MKEKTIGSGVYAAEQNNSANSVRSCFVTNAEDGPLVHPGASSTDVLLNIDATTIRVDGDEWALPSGTETLEPNSSAYPRRDLVIARKGATPSDPGSYDHLTGDPISADTFRDLTYDDPDEPHTPILNDNGLPLHPVENIPQIQPPAATGLRNEGPVLAMVYVPPGTADSTDISDAYITDLAKEGVSFENVLRDGEAIQNIETLDRPLEVNARSAERFGHQGEIPFRRSTRSIAMCASDDKRVIKIRPGNECYIWEAGVSDRDGVNPANAYARVYVVQSDGTVSNMDTSTHQTSEVFGIGASDNPIDGGLAVGFDCEPGDGVPEQVTAHFSFSILPDDVYPVS